MLFAGALRCCPGQPCEICGHPSPKEGTGQVMLDYVPQQKIQIPNDKLYLHFNSSFPVHHKWKHLQKVLISKILFPSLSKENVFSNPWKGFTENPVTSPKGPFSPHGSQQRFLDLSHEALTLPLCEISREIAGILSDGILHHFGPQKRC